MTDDAFDAALVAAAFELGAAQGWRAVNAAAACQRAGLDIAIARRRFPTRSAILARFGAMADAHALAGAAPDGLLRERLFDILLRRFDFLQTQRAGVLALLRALPTDPALALWLTAATERAMGWMLEAAGAPSGSPRAALRRAGLLAVWGWGLRAWMNDETADLSATMAAVDTALARADQLAARFDPFTTAEVAASIGDEPELPFAAEESVPPA